MREYDFTLKFKLHSPDIDPDLYIDKLYESRCDDALVGIGKKGYMALNFAREASSAVEAICSAIENVKEAVPQAVLLNVSPDLVGITDIANLLGCSRQNVRKLIGKDDARCPDAIYQGAQSIWHLSEILSWLAEEKAYPIDESLLEIARVAMNVNVAKQSAMADPEIQENFKALVA